MRTLNAVLVLSTMLMIQMMDEMQSVSQLTDSFQTWLRVKFTELLQL